MAARSEWSSTRSNDVRINALAPETLGHWGKREHTKLAMRAVIRNWNITVYELGLCEAQGCRISALAVEWHQ
jgi:hypothetical protein